MRKFLPVMGWNIAGNLVGETVLIGTLSGVMSLRDKATREEFNKLILIELGTVIVQIKGFIPAFGRRGATPRAWLGKH